MYIADTNRTYLTNILRQYDGLYGDLNHRHQGSYLFSELIETRSKGFGWVIQPHFHLHLYQVFVVEAGELEMQSPVPGLHLRAPCIMYIPPSVLHGFSYSQEVRGRILTLSGNWVEGFFEKLPQVALLMESFGHIHFPPGREGLFLRVQQLAREIEEELFAEQPEKKAFLQAQIHQFWLLLYRLRKEDAPEASAGGHLMLDHFRRFQHCIQETSPIPPIPEIARSLGVSTVHLNRICRQVSGKPARTLIQEELVLQARKYLTYTSYTISEIAYLLHFEYPNYFARLFKKHTGLSPGAYRARGHTQSRNSLSFPT